MPGDDVDPASSSTSHIHPALIPDARRRHHSAHEFLGRPQAFAEGDEQPPADSSNAEQGDKETTEDVKAPHCFSKNGALCNRNQMDGVTDEERKLDARMAKLRKAETEPWFWPAIHDVNRDANAQKANVQAKVDDYLNARKKFDHAFESYQASAVKWQSALRGIEDDYALYCRPFHDVTMPCERRYRQVLRWWFAREPLPECPVGVVTPYSKLPTGKGLLSGLTSMFA